MDYYPANLFDYPNCAGVNYPSVWQDPSLLSIFILLILLAGLGIIVLLGKRFKISEVAKERKS